MYAFAPLVVAATLISSLAQVNLPTDRSQTVRQAQADRMLQQENREALKERLQIVKDERKRAIAENIDKRISEVNQKWVAHWSRTLDRLSAILDKIETRAQSSGAADTDAFYLALAGAREAIDNAQVAVTTQEGKTYEIVFTDEAILGQAIRSTIADFHNDLKLTQAAVKEAKDATVMVLRHLKDVVGQEPSGNPETN
jgi:Tfp pilus assembly protein PilN